MWSVGLLVVACESDGDNNPPFGVPATATASATGATGATGTGSSSGSSTGGESGSASSGGTSSDGSTTGLSTSGSTSQSSTGASETATIDPGMQPADGLYSTCLAATDCDPAPALCITINDADDNPTTGFCSQTGCTNAAVDCVPTPGATNLPACIPVTVDGMDTSACALDCSGSAACPAPMTCVSLAFGMICA